MKVFHDMMAEKFFETHLKGFTPLKSLMLRSNLGDNFRYHEQTNTIVSRIKVL